ERKGLAARIARLVWLTDASDLVNRVVALLFGSGATYGTVMAWQRDQPLVIVLAAGAFALFLLALLVTGAEPIWPRYSYLALHFLPRAPYVVSPTGPHDRWSLRQIEVENASTHATLENVHVTVRILDPPQALGSVRLEDPITKAPQP